MSETIIKIGLTNVQKVGVQRNFFDTSDVDATMINETTPFRNTCLR